MTTKVEKNVESPAGEVTTLNVSNLSYTPAPKFIKRTLEYVRYHLTLVNLDWFLPFYKGENRKLQLLGAPLRNVNFTAFGGELVALLGTDPERLEIIQLLTGRKKEGSYDGFISLRGSAIAPNAYYYHNVTYVQKKPLFIPGLTYYDMVAYAVALRADSSVDVKERIEDILTIMNLHRCKHHVIEAYPATRGEAGCDFRRLSIALEIVSLPPLIVIDEPALSFDPIIALKIYECLKRLTKRGHIVFCSVAKPSQAEFSMFDRVVLLADGYSIYSAAPNQVDQHFCSAEMGYQRKKDVTLIDFATDICSGIERPDTMRVAEHASIMQEKFEASRLFTSPSHDANNAHAFTAEFFKYFGYFTDIPSFSVQFSRFLVILKRAVYTKVTNVQTMKSLFGASTILSSFIGYLQYGQGDYGNFCLSIVGIPYKQTANVGSLIFFISMFTQAYFFVDAHSLCQKLQLFRYEQAAGVSTTLAFIMATLVSEAPAALLFGLIFGSILFGMSQVHGDYNYFISAVVMACCVGLSCAIMYCGLFKNELAVRDMFFVSLAVVVLLSGFPFSQSSMPDYLIQFSSIIPTRWIFEALYKWYFSRKIDGFVYLTVYSYNSFDRSTLFVILTNFLLAINAITCVTLLPEPMLMYKKAGAASGKRDSSRDSIGSNGSSFDGDLPGSNMPSRRMSERPSETVQPIMFMRASTVTGRQSKLSVNMSQMGEENTSRGPTVMLNEISYRVRDPSSPMGYKTVLSNVSGQFDWGKLNMILGAPQCGKSSLMNIIAGNTGANAEVGGQVTFNGIAPKADAPIWERCAFVPTHNEHIRDLTVKEVVTFAMKLRCYNKLGLSVVAENVETTIANLHLEDVAHKKVKFLNSGEYKRLSIAEEIVHGPKLLLIDEPITGVSLRESSILLNTFREMVNADRTVVCSMYHPSVDAFNLFDSLLLLSKGRVIYSGRIGAATEFFTSSPYQYSLTGYTNPADFLADVSSSQLPDCRGEFIDGSLLENYYMQSENYKRIQSRFKAATLHAATRTEGTQNPLRGFMSPPSTPGDLDTSKASAASSDLKSTSSFEMEGEGEKSNKNVTAKPAPKMILALKAAWAFVTKPPSWTDFTDSLFKRQILLERSARSLLGRHELIIGSMVMHVLLAVLFGWVNKNVTPASVIAYLGIGTMFLLIANAQLIFYMFTNYHVFLKEHSRGLYSSYTNYTVHSMPMYLLKIINAILFAVVSWGWMDVDNSTDTFGFIILCFILVVLAGCMLSEIAVILSDSVPAAYISIGIVAALQFVASGLILKAGSFPLWMRPWVPSLSMLRWIMQAGFIKVYNNNTDAFPVLPIPGVTYTQYPGFLNLFGWGGKTEWYCVGMLVINIIIFRFIMLLSMAYKAFKAKGTHKEKIYK